MAVNSIYLDNNATTHILPEVVAAMQECYTADLANPASQHAQGRRARQMLEDARERIAELVGAKTSGTDRDAIIFTSGATEANNLAVSGFANLSPRFGAISAIEHPSVLTMCEELVRRGKEIETLSATPNGVVSLQAVHQAVDRNASWLSVMAVNHETGVIQPVDEIAKICADHGILFHCDAVQSIGKCPLHFNDSAFSSMSISAHKFHGPPGIGALVVHRNVRLTPLMFGGAQQFGMRPGTECLALIVGMRVALEAANVEKTLQAQAMEKLRCRFEKALLDGLNNVLVIGEDSPRAPHTTNVSFRGLDRQAILMALDLAKVACSAGSACASGASEPSPVLRAMQLKKEIVKSSLRFSLSRFSTASQIDQAAERIISAIRSLQRS